jgi:Fur family transcriptional regulator, ferric uptake regulator
MLKQDSPGLRALRAAGYKLTTPRVTIIEALEKHNGHLTSAQLVDMVQQRDPHIGRASVFRTLDLMIKLGIIWPTLQGGSTVNYLLMPGGHHHHIVCTTCSKLIEFADCRLDTLINAVQQEYGVRIDGHLLELYGECSDCRALAPLVRESE